MKSYINKVFIFATLLSLILANETTQSQWTKCANESGVCNFTGFKIVRYGLDGIYNYKGGYRTLGCNNIVFGDPVKGKVKVCEFSTAEYDWTSCGKEGEICKFRGSKFVRYGANGNFNYILAKDTIECSKIIFGDPPGAGVNTCSYGEEIDPNQFAWGKCADENGICKFKGNQVVRYGINDSWGYITANSQINCNNRVFGDAWVGPQKSCEYQLINETVCPDNLLLNGRQCLPKCPANSLVTADGKQCVVKCPSGSLFLEGTSNCVNSCPVSHYKSGDTCIKCKSGYKQSLDTFKPVLDCAPNKVLVFASFLTNDFDACYDWCPTGYKLFAERRECYLDCADIKLLTSADNKFCVPSCLKKQFLLGQDCYNDCPKTYYQHKRTCVLECPAGTIKSPDNRSCLDTTPGVKNVRYVEVLSGTGSDSFLQISQIVVKNPEGQNIAKGKPVTGTSWDKTKPSNAVDGVENNKDFPNIYQAASPNKEKFTVDLQTSSVVYSVELFNRKDCCQGRIVGATIRLLDPDMESLGELVVKEGLAKIVYDKSTPSTCPAGSFMVKGENRCVYSCPTSYYLNANECVASCPVGTWPSSDNYRCINACPTGQFIHKKTSKCFSTCPSNFLVNGNECVEECPDSKILAADLRTCVDSCPTGQYLIAGRKSCYFRCPVNWKISGNTCVCRFSQ
jgi:hypothetical protein